MSDDSSSHRGSPEQEIWYHAAHGRAEGPLGRDELLGLLARGDLPRSAPVWRPGMETWTPARDVEELAGMLPPPVDAGETDPPGEPEPPADASRADESLPRLPDPAGLPPTPRASDWPRGSAEGVRSSGWPPVAAGAAVVLVAGVAAWILGGGAVSGPLGAEGQRNGARSDAASLEGRIRAVARAHRTALSDSLERLPAGDSLQRVHEEGGLAWTRRIGFSGLPRLSDRMLVTHAELMGEALGAAPQELCTAVAQWRASSDEYWRFLAGLEPEGMARLLEVLRRGVMAELRGRSQWPVPERAAVREAFAILGDRLSEAARDSLRQVLAPGATPDPEAACWTERTLYRGVPRLPDPWRAVLARALVTG